MKKWIPLVVFAAGAGCASTDADLSTTLSSGAAAGSGTGSSSSGGGSSTSGGDAGALPCGLGNACSGGSCESCGLRCDATSVTCRLPESGEACTPDAGCAAQPPGLTCSSVSQNGLPARSLCEIPCSGGAGNCPYGTSCGDPDLPGFCSPFGTPCTAWAPCTLGTNLYGQCLPTGTGTTVCLAEGTETDDATCNPAALNASAAELCATGSVCTAVPLTLGGTATAGSCFTLCGGDQLTCPAMTHCDQPSTSAYGVCRPGIGCQVGNLDTCPVDTVCVPDRTTSLVGGCLAVSPDAGDLGDGCTPSTIVGVSPCAFGACMPGDGGDICTALCNLTDGGGPFCVEQTCAPLVPGDDTEVIGICQ